MNKDFSVLIKRTTDFFVSTTSQGVVTEIFFQPKYRAFPDFEEKLSGLIRSLIQKTLSENLQLSEQDCWQQTATITVTSACIPLVFEVTVFRHSNNDFSIVGKDITASQADLAALNRRNSFVKFLESVLGSLLRAEPHQIENRLRRVPLEISKFLGAAESILYLRSDDGFFNRFAVFPESVEITFCPILEIFLKTPSPSFINNLSQKTPFLCELKELVEESIGTNKQSQANKNEIALVIPVFCGTEVLGFNLSRNLNFEMLPPNEIASLGLVGEMIGSAVYRQRFETFRAESQERLNGILNSIEDSVWSIDLGKNQLLFFNPVTETMLGRNSVEILSNPGLWFDIAHPEDIEIVSNWRKEVEENGQAEYQYRIVRPDGTIRWLHARLWLAYSVSGAPTRIDGIATDITAAKEAEQAIKKAREREVEIAAKIQQTLLIGRPPEGLNGIQIASFTIPSSGVDGDFYDFFHHSPTCVDILIGDVMGKGIPAALIGAAAKAAFLRAFGLQPSRNIASSLQSIADITNTSYKLLGKHLISLKSFITLCYSRINAETKEIEFVDGGHTKTLLYHAKDDSICYLSTENSPFGFVPDETYISGKAKLAENDVLVFYSDGLTESSNAFGEQFELINLEKAVREFSAGSAEDIANGILKKISEFTGKERFEDDLTCIVVKV